MEHPDEVGPAWDVALRADRPCVIDAVIDPNVPPLPPHIKYDQARSYAQAVLKGDPDALKIIWQSVRKGVKAFSPALDRIAALPQNARQALEGDTDGG